MMDEGVTSVDEGVGTARPAVEDPEEEDEVSLRESPCFC